MTTLQEVIELLEDEIIVAQDGVDRWTDNRSKCNNRNAGFTDNDCWQMQRYYTGKKELVEEHLKLVKSITEL
jgi:hypothetical protein